MKMFDQVRAIDELNQSGNIRECYKWCMSTKMANVTWRNRLRSNEQCKWWLTIRQDWKNYVT